MSKKLKLALVVMLLAFAAALLAGCSGAGAPATSGAASALETAAADNLSGFLLVSTWLDILYPPQSAVTSDDHDEIVTVDGVKVHHQWGTRSDGSHYDYMWNYANNALTGSITFSDGGVMDYVWGPVTLTPQMRSQSGRTTYPGGQSLSWHRVVDFSVSPVTETRTGEATIASGERMDFRWVRTNNADTVELTLPDGSVLQMGVPLAPPQGATVRPDFAEGGTGTYSTAGHPGMSFHFTGQNDRWDHLEMTSADGMGGGFAVDPAMAGSGSILQGDVVQALFGWTPDFAGHLRQVGAGAQQVSASAAARDFAITRWVSNVAVLGPTPF